MTNDGLENAQKSLTELLSVLEIGQVIFIDDSFEKDFNHATVIGWLSEVEEKVPRQIIKRLDKIDFENPEIWKRQFIDFWRGLNDGDKRELVFFISETLGKSLKDDRKIDENLSKLFGKKILFYSPTEWENNKSNIFKKTTDKEKLFCIFDQDLSLSKNFGAQGPNPDKPEPKRESRTRCGLPEARETG